MSYTEIYGLTDNDAFCIGETKNAWRGAMKIWMDLERKYLPSLPPHAWEISESEKQEYHSRTSMLFDESKMKEIWELVNNANMTVNERIVMASTFDNVLVRKENISRLLDAFNEYSNETSLKEQAEIIRLAVEEDEEIIAIGWNQTSVTGDTWHNAGGYDEDDNPIGYSMERQSEHWFLFEELDKDLLKEGVR